MVFSLSCMLEWPRELLRIPVPRLPPWLIISESLGLGLRHQSCMKLPRWFRCAATFENQYLVIWHEAEPLVYTHFRLVEVTLVVDITLINFHGAYIYQEETNSPVGKSKLSVLCLERGDDFINKYSHFLKQIISTTGTSKSKGLLKFFLVNWLQISLSVNLIDYSIHTLKYS